MKCPSSVYMVSRRSGVNRASSYGTLSFSKTEQKLKKAGAKPPTLKFAENPDILQSLSNAGDMRSPLVIGFAAETEDIIENAAAKRLKKGCDWIVANDVSPETGTFGGDKNTVHLVVDGKVESWPTMTKEEVAERLAARISAYLAGAR